MTNTATGEQADGVWGPYPSYDDIARFEYGRLLWRSVEMRSRLLRHWMDPRHPYRERFLRHQALLEEILRSHESPESIDQRLRERNTSLRAIAREIPPVFGTFFVTSPAQPAPAGVL